MEALWESLLPQPLCARGLRVVIVERNVLKGVISASLTEISAFYPTQKRVDKFFEGLD